MSYPEIFSDGYVHVVHDDADDQTPIGIAATNPDSEDPCWIDRAEAVEVATAILRAVAEPVELPAPTGDLNSDLIGVAIAHERSIRFRYAKGQSEASIELRTLKPEKLTQAGADKHAVVQGYDPDRDDFRMYRLDRIKGKVSIG